jgi:hypothetical protein
MTSDDSFDGAVGVSECIIMGVPIPIGTGIFKLSLKPPTDVKIPVSQHVTRLLDVCADA